ncbi:MAG: 3-oxoacyl-ACP reductase FabG [Anaerolineae bacterium]|nr:3-oxoacyl-ACP reductase FabG [Anaerolineae bacterium]
MAENTIDLSGKTAIITGGGSGIGAGIALMFGALGANLVIGDVEMETAEEVAAELEQAGYPVLLIQVDVQDAERVDALVEQAVARFGGVDILVNSAGVGTLSSIVDMLEEEWDWVLGVNLKGTFLCTRAVARWWLQNGRRGKIINLSSINEAVPLAGESHYCASKGGVMMFTRSAALELAPHGIHVNAIAPAMIETPMIEEVIVVPELRAAHQKQVPFGRFGQPEDVAKVAAFLVSPWADWITGASIPVDGGMHLIGEESYIWAIERAMGHHGQIPKVPMCWPPGALEEESKKEEAK